MDLQGPVLLSTIEGGDLMVLDAKYHLVCLAGLQNRECSMRQYQNFHSSHVEEGKMQARAFVELISYVENTVKDGMFCFKFSSLHRPSSQRARLPLYVESIKALVPSFFALDYQNYSSWISVHIHDMESLPISIYQEFKEHGHWVLQKNTS